MSITLTCHDCERRIELPERPESGKVYCPSCRTRILVPKEGEAEDEVGDTYALPRVKRCVECDAELPARATLCVNCGYNLRTHRKTERAVRVKEVSHGWAFGAVPLYVVDACLRRSRSGRQEVSLRPQIFFIPIGTTTIDLRDCDELWIEYRQGFGPVGLTIMLILCLFCVVPGLIWWILAFSKPTYIIRLPVGRGAHVTLYEGSSEATMQEILDTISSMSDLNIIRK
jgi:ribosomal protein L40E